MPRIGDVKSLVKDIDVSNIEEWINVTPFLIASSLIVLHTMY